MLIRVFCVVSMLNKLSRGGGGGATGLVNKGGGSSRLPGLVTKQQAVEFPHAGTDYSKELIIIATINLLCCICSY